MSFGFGMPSIEHFFIIIDLHIPCLFPLCQLFSLVFVCVCVINLEQGTHLSPGRPLDGVSAVKRARRGHVVRLVHIKTELLPVSDLSLSPEFSAFLVSPFYSLVKHAEQSGTVEDTSGTRHKGEIRSEGWILRNMAEIYNTRPGVV
jgi:hypothetical protein